MKKDSYIKPNCSGTRKAVSKDIGVRKKAEMANQVIYTANPKHKWPGGWGTLCPRNQELISLGLSSLDMLKIALHKGAHSPLNDEDNFPDRVWFFHTELGFFEAQGNNGVYHGYPIHEIEAPPQIISIKWDE